LATNADGRQIYVGTDMGLVKSSDGGESWKSVTLPLPNTAAVQITAITVNPADSQQVYVALAANSTVASAPPRAMGIYASKDGGDSWHLLPDSPSEYVTHRLAVDSAQPKMLFGATGMGTWRYKLSDRGFASRPN
jgi:hypothetical protein